MCVYVYVYVNVYVCVWLVCTRARARAQRCIAFWVHSQDYRCERRAHEYGGDG
jgi:hypothetical protein